MPIHLNLLEGERAAARETARDPFRISILICVSILLLAVGSGFIFAAMSIVSQTRLARAKAEAEEKEKEQQGAQSRLNELARLAQKQGTAQMIRSNRFLFAPQLQAIKESIPDNVQLVRLGFEWETVKVPNPRLAAKARPEVAVEGSGRQIPAEVDEKRMHLTIEGYIAGDNPEVAMRKFMQQLNRMESSATTAGTVQSIPLAGFLQQAELKSYSSVSLGPQRPGGPPLPQADVGRFVISCYYSP